MYRCLVEMNKETVRQYMWPHYDYGTSQGSAGWKAQHNHGDKVGKSIFRLLDKDFRKDWLKEALPIAKEIWSG